MSARTRQARATTAAALLVGLMASAQAAAQGQPGTRPPSDEGPPTTFGFVLGLVMLAVVVVGIPLGSRLLRRRQARPSALPALGPGVDLAAIHREGLRAGVLRADVDRLLREVQGAWDSGDSGRLEELITPRLAAQWLPRLEGGETLEWADEVRVIGPVDVAILELGPGRPLRGTLEVQTRLSGSLDNRAVRADPAARLRVARGERSRRRGRRVPG